MKQHHYPPGPPSRWPGGHAASLINAPLQLFRRCAQEYGDIASVRVFNRRVYVLSNPDYIKHVLVANQKNYEKGRALGATRQVIGEGLLTSEGDFHHQQRFMMQPAFHRHQVAGYAETMSRLTQAHVAGWRNGQSLDLHQEMMQVTMKIAAQTLFGADISPNYKKLTAALNDLMNDFTFLDATPVGQLLSRMPTRRNFWRKRRLDTLDDAIYGFIRAGREKGQEQYNLLAMLLAAHLTEGQPRLSLGQIRDEVMTLFIAGHETTANAIVWTFYLLAQHPAIEARLQAEVDAVLGGRLPTAEDARQLKYTRMVLSEAMRLYPPAWAIGRRAVADDEIGGYKIPANAGVVFSQWVMHRHPLYWREPLAFQPERFDPDLDPQPKRPRYAYFPFGGGARACIGEAFAWLEGVLLIAMLAQQFRFEVPPNVPVEPQPGITLRPKYGLPVVVKQRNSQSSPQKRQQLLFDAVLS
jgi:cytochrome P450